MGDEGPGNERRVGRELQVSGVLRLPVPSFSGPSSP